MVSVSDSCSTGQGLNDNEIPHYSEACCNEVKL